MQLMKDDEFDALARHAKDSPRLFTRPFTPYVGEAFPTTKPGRGVLVCGKATNGWREDVHVARWTHEVARDAAKKFCVEEIAKKRYGSAFWRYACQLVREFDSGLAGESDPVESLAWTNCALLGLKKGQRPPKGPELWRQWMIASAVLRRCVDKLSPRVVIFVTGSYGDEVRGRAFSDVEWIIGARGDTMSARRGKSLLFVQPHPQGKSEGTLKRYVAELHELIR